ncbi:hypothetical protein [Flavobacterium sp.]|uniref:hypothetical protein n=1 Tax=Flavobacterium sp. TaxID=239 RepID=UPI0026311E25|nr:hypothetical protein [Flavobacterium sp.]MDD3003292.1 hypothetical protein [Flavobacterium sp.]
MSKDKFILWFLALIVMVGVGLLISIHFEEQETNVEFEKRRIKLNENYVRRRDSANRIHEERIQYYKKIKDSLEEVIDNEK